MVPFLSGFFLTPLNKMVVQNENIVTFLMLSAPFSFLPLFLSAFGVRLHSLLCTPLIIFLHQLHTTNHHLSFSMVKLLITPLFGFLVVLVLSPFLLMNEQSSSLVLVSIVSLVMVLWSHFSSPSCLPSCWVLGPSSFHKSSIVSCVLFLRVSHFYWSFPPSLSWTYGGFFNISCLFRQLISSSVPGIWPACLESCGTTLSTVYCWSWTSLFHSGKHSSPLSYWLSLLFCSCHPLWTSHLSWAPYWPSLAASYERRTRCPS